MKKVGNHNFLLEGLVRCGYCGSVMAPRWALSKGRRYFYYECTSVGHSGKEVCKVRQISAEALEDVIIERIRQISRDEFLLQRILSNTNKKTEKEIRDLEAGKIVLRLRIAEFKKQIKKLLNKYVDSEDEALNKLLADEMKELEAKKEELEKEIEIKDTLIGELKNYVINAQLVRDTFKYFNEVYEQLSDIEKKNLISLMIREIEFTKERIKIEFYEVPEIEVIIKKGSTDSFAEPLFRLPVLNKFRTIPIKVENAIILNNTTAPSPKINTPKSYKGQIPFGYDFIDNELKENPQEQEIINFIFQLKSQGFSLREIAKELNKKSIPTKNNGIWQANTIRKILQREKEKIAG